MKIIEERARKVCGELEAAGIFRRISDSETRWKVNLASNDYLGVVHKGLLKPSLARSARLCATGGSSSRLVFGTSMYHRLLEEKLASHFGYEAALVFTSGFMANYGLCSVLKELADVVLIDKRVHASVVDGLMQTMGGKAEVRSYKHNDVRHYSRLCSKHGAGETITITESLFSMTGRLCDPDIIHRAAGHGFLVVDEAHSLGACRPGGTAVFGRAKGADITIGTFGKAYGCAGGFILCSESMRQFLVNRCRSFIFTTALPEVYAAVGIDAIDLVSGMDEEREKLAGLARSLSNALQCEGFRSTGDAHIIAIYCCSAQAAVKVSGMLRDAGIALYAVRPPTVPPQEILLRVSLNAFLEPEDIDYFLDRLLEIRSAFPGCFSSRIT